MVTHWLRSVASTRLWSLRNLTFGSKPGKGSAWKALTSIIRHSPPCLSISVCSWTGWTCWRPIKTRSVWWKTRNMRIENCAWSKRLPMRKLADSFPICPKSSKSLKMRCPDLSVILSINSFSIVSTYEEFIITIDDCFLLDCKYRKFWIERVI